VIIRSHGANVAVRSLNPGNWGGIDPYTAQGLVPPPALDGGQGSPLSATWRQAYGLPAVLFCILLASRAGSQLPCDVYRPSGEGSEKAYDAPQRELLHDRPIPGENVTTRMVWYCLIASLLGRGNGLIYKLKGRSGVVGLQPVAASNFDVTRSRGKKRYYIGRGEVDASEVIHVAGDVLDDPEIGVSPLTLARETVGTGLSQQHFESRYYDSDGTPGGVIELEGSPNREKRREFLEQWERRLKPGSRKVGLLWNGAKYTSIGVSLADAQYAEAAQLSSYRAALMLGMPPAMLDAHDDKFPDITDRRFRELFMQPLLTAIAQALHVDDDLFPDKTLFPGFITNALLRPSLKDRADAYRLMRQGGVLTANELRALEDYPERSDGDELLATPVGGAPNPAAASRSDLNS
jgi:HK97 family phage portal protein